MKIPSAEYYLAVEYAPNIMAVYRRKKHSSYVFQIWISKDNPDSILGLDQSKRGIVRNSFKENYISNFDDELFTCKKISKDEAFLIML